MEDAATEEVFFYSGNFQGEYRCYIPREGRSKTKWNIRTERQKWQVSAVSWVCFFKEERDFLWHHSQEHHHGLKAFSCSVGVCVPVWLSGRSAGEKWEHKCMFWLPYSQYSNRPAETSKHNQELSSGLWVSKICWAISQGKREEAFCCSYSSSRGAKEANGSLYIETGISVVICMCIFIMCSITQLPPSFPWGD